MFRDDNAIVGVIFHELHEILETKKLLKDTRMTGRELLNQELLSLARTVAGPQGGATHIAASHLEDHITWWLKGLVE